MRAIVPAYDEAPTDVLHVLEACDAADLEPVLVWQGHLSTEAVRLIGPFLHGPLVLPHAVGKGRAVKEALRALAVTREPFLVVDADLHALDPTVLREFAEAASAGAWARPLYDRPGRVAHRLTPALRALGLPIPPALDHGGLLGPIQGHPHAVHARLSPRNGPAWDVDVALRYLTCDDADRHPLAVIPAGDRRHRPGDDAHLTRMLEDHLTAAARWVQW